MGSPNEEPHTVLKTQGESLSGGYLDKTVPMVAVQLIGTHLQVHTNCPLLAGGLALKQRQPAFDEGHMYSGVFLIQDTLK